MPLVRRPWPPKLDACRLLQTRQVDVMLAGATDRTMDPATFAKFFRHRGAIPHPLFSI